MASSLAEERRDVEPTDSSERYRDRDAGERDDGGREQRDRDDRNAQTMNTMLDRLERATIRQRALVADAAHELRSPLASIRADLEITTAHQSSDDVPSVLERTAETTRRMGNLVEDLLVLATADEQEGQPRTVDVDPKS